MFKNDYGEFLLDRYPAGSDRSLRAWDAADEYLLHALYARQLDLKSKRILIVNDAFGALSCSLSEYEPVLFTDSFLSCCALKQNLLKNDLSGNAVSIKNVRDSLVDEFDIVIIKVPKQLKMLEWELNMLRNYINEDTLIIAGAMTKYLPKSAIKLFENIIGPTSTSLAKKKARLTYSKYDAGLSCSLPAYPERIDLEGEGLSLFSYPNVFASDKFDIGARFFIEHFDKLPEAENVIDLGCGNGVLSLFFKRKYSQSKILCIDESFMAVKSAAETLKRNGFAEGCEFKVGDALTGVPDNSADLVLCNPPFHQNHTVSRVTSNEMFEGARRVLRNDGQLWVISNRHLGYHVVLKKIFGNCEVVAGNKKFVVLRSVKKVN